MTFRDYFIKHREELSKVNPTTVTELFKNRYIWEEFPDRASFIKDKDGEHAERLRNTCIEDTRVLPDLPSKQERLRRLISDLDEFALLLSEKLNRRLMKSRTDKQGKVSLANAQSPVQVDERIHGDRVLHFTTAFGAIVQSNKLRISGNSDQGCLFCIPVRYADEIALCPPSEVKELFDIRQDLSHYLEFNLEGSRDFESYNSHISAKLKGQKELKIHSEILNLDRRDPVWYEWKGKGQGGWAVVPGPYPWGK